jgi:hypothetical protein
MRGSARGVGLVSDPRRSRCGHTIFLAAVPAGSELAVGADRGLLQLWEVSGTPHLVRALSALRPTRHLPEAIQSVAFSADDRLIAARDTTTSRATDASLGSIAIWRTRTGAPVTALSDWEGLATTWRSPRTAAGSRSQPERPGRGWPGADPRLLKRKADPRNSPARRRPRRDLQPRVRPKRNARNRNQRRRRPTLEPVNRRSHQPSLARRRSTGRQHRVRSIRATLRDGRQTGSWPEAVVHLEPSTRRRNTRPRTQSSRSGSRMLSCSGTFATPARRGLGLAVIVAMTCLCDCAGLAKS